MTPGNILLKPAQFLNRTRQSAVVWAWAFNGLRLASGLILLPLLARELPKPEFGMYYVFLSITALLPFLDLGFSGTIGRFVGYAMAGATKLQPQGFVPCEAANPTPNLPLLWSLLKTTRALYGYIALFGMLVMGSWGTVLVGSKIHETANPSYTWLAWGVTLFAAGLELYSYWWNTFLYCTNQVRESSRIAFFAYAARTVLSCVFLLLGGGLLSVAGASLFGSSLSIALSRRGVLATLGAPPPDSHPLSRGSMLHLVWPNSWRLALQVFGNYLRTNANTQICVAFLGLAATAEYGLSIQVVNIAFGMSMVWTSVKWPRAAQLRSLGDTQGLKNLFWPRVWLQNLSFLGLAVGALLVVPTFLKWIGTDKQLLSPIWLALLALSYLLELNFVFWGSLLAVENRIPTLWSSLTTNVAAVLIALVLVPHTGLGAGGLIVAPLISGSLFIYWYWPRAAARTLQTTWLRFMFHRFSRTTGKP